MKKDIKVLGIDLAKHKLRACHPLVKRVSNLTEFNYNQISSINAFTFNQKRFKTDCVYNQNDKTLMKRLLYYDLVKWCTSSTRKPLLLRGARQVSKTHIVRELGKRFKHYKVRRSRLSARILMYCRVHSGSARRSSLPFALCSRVSQEV